MHNIQTHDTKPSKDSHSVNLLIQDGQSSYLKHQGFFNEKH